MKICMAKTGRVMLMSKPALYKLELVFEGDVNQLITQLMEHITVTCYNISIEPVEDKDRQQHYPIINKEKIT